MSRKRKPKLSNETIEVRYSNWLAQMLAIMMPRILALIAGRGTSKTVDIQVERIQEAVYDCPGAPFGFVSDTYTNLHKNIIPSMLEGLRLKGWEEDIHYVINKRPPDEWEKKMYNKVTSWKHTMVFFTGFNFTFISLDRPAIGAGNSYVGLFGDEVKYFSEKSIANIMKAVRGYKAKFGESPFYRSISFTTDMPDPNNIGESSWIFNLAKQNDKQKILDLLNCGFIFNEVKKEYVSALNSGNKKETLLAERNMKRWEDRWKKLRKQTSFFWIASSFVNADILSNEWFDDEFSAGLEGVNASILSIIPKLSAAARFYAALSEKHFYNDGINYDYIDTLPFGSETDCRELKYLDSRMAIEAGLDVGNTLWLLLSQTKMNTIRIMKELYTLPPDYIRQLADQFLKYFKPHGHKRMKLYYDRAANSYSKVKQDVASQLKKAIEIDAEGKRTGWTVQLMSIGQGNISSNAEYNFMMELMTGRNKDLPKLLIDRNTCPYLKTQMENTKTKVKQRRNGTSEIVKEKKTDSLPTNRLLKESTNFTDAFKYLLCRKTLMRLVNRPNTATSLSPKSN
jgi:hypothetical protein